MFIALEHLQACGFIGYVAAKVICDNSDSQTYGYVCDVRNYWLKEKFVFCPGVTNNATVIEVSHLLIGGADFYHTVKEGGNK